LLGAEGGWYRLTSAVSDFTLFHVVRNNAFSETDLVDLVTNRLRSRLPSAWRVEIREPSVGRNGPDACLHISSPGGSTAAIAVGTFSPRTTPDLRNVLEIMRRFRQEMPDAILLAAAPYFSPRIRSELTRNGIAYADATGNLRLAVDEPALFIETTGADRDPSPNDQPLRSLRGAAAGRAVRAFCDYSPPYGTRELSERAGVPAPTLSRVAELLERDGILTRERSRGPIVAVDWEAAIRRWAQDYSFTQSNRVSSWLEPRGLPALLRKLRELETDYAVTGSLAASAVEPITAPRLATVYVERAEAVADVLGLRPAETGANVLLAEPFDRVVFARGFEQDGLQYTARSQLAVDLLTGPGRSPAEGEAILQWMQENERTWRA
jgi:hypothetical protein